MKKIVKTIIAIFTVISCIVISGILMTEKTYAGGVSIYPSADQVTIGDSITVTVTLYGSEIYAFSGNIGCDGIFSGPVEGFADGADGGESVSFSYTYRAVGEGTGSIYVGDCSVSDGITREDCGGDSCTITVVGDDNGGGGTGGNAGGNDYNDDYSIDGGYVNGNETGQGSGNCDLASLSVEGYEIKDEGHEAYSLSVGGSVDKINIVATPSDEKATVNGAGEHALTIGENRFEIIVVAENGLSKSYVITVTRRGSKILMADLLKELSETKEEAITIELKDGDKLTAEMIEAVKKWGKTLTLNRYSEDGKIQYGWTFDGKTIGELKEFNPEVKFESKSIDKINELANYATGKVISFSHSGKLPKGTKFTLNISGDFKKNDIIRLYYYDEMNKTLSQEGNDITVSDEYATFEISHCSDYFLTRSKIGGAAVVKTENKKELFMMIAMIVEFVIIIALVAFIVIKLNKNKKNGKNNKNNNNRNTRYYDDDYNENLVEIDYQDL